MKTPTPAAEAMPSVRRALEIAEAALADIGDADREPGDDLAWCERRAAEALPAIRAALASPAQPDRIETVQQLMAITEERDALRQALEVIAVGDAKAPIQSAAEELVALGFWRADAVALASPSAPAQPVAPAGWQLVPVEPTNAMTFVGQQLRRDPTNSISHVYGAMLAAAPSASEAPRQEDAA